MFGILAADKLAEEGLDYINQQPDATLIDRPGLSEAEYAALLQAGGIQAMIVRSGIRVTETMLRQPGDLKVIARAGVGVDNIDLAAATERGILVVNTAEASTLTTAELAFSMMAALLRNLGAASDTMRRGGWDRAKFKGRQLHGMTLGVVGLGRIGRTVAERAIAFGMTVLGYDPFVTEDLELAGETVRTFRSFDELCGHVDVLTFHVPKTELTAGMLNTQTFAKCREGVYVVNAARGGIVDEAAAFEALESGRCAGLALDVWEQEPPPADHPLRNHPRALCLPHLGASTVEAQTAVSVDAAKACLAYLRGEGIRGAVNAGGFRVDLNPRQQAYVELARRMSKLLAPMITRGIRSVRINAFEAGLEGAAGTLEREVLIGLLSRYAETPLNPINVANHAAQRGVHTEIRTVTGSDAPAPGMGDLCLEVEGPDGAVDGETPAADRVRRIVGRVYADGQPRVVEINGYRMDMVPEGAMVLVQNRDQPGVIGHVGEALGSAGVNIADMTIARRPADGGGYTALMLLNVDGDVIPENALTRLTQVPGVLRVAAASVT